MTLTLAIIMFFRRETGISDIIFLATLLLTHHSDIIPGLSVNDDQSINRNVTLSKSSDTGMRFIPLIVLCVSVPIVLSPLMLSLWLGNASGNANFLFFQGFVLWVFYALAIIEFTNHTIRSIEEP